MRLGLFIVGLLIGLLGGAGGIGYLAAKIERDESQIFFSEKEFFDNDASITVTGTLTGDNVVFPNNTYRIRCFKDQKLCWFAFVEQLGPKAIGSINGPSSFEVVKWTPYEVIASDDGGAYGCDKTTITISRKAKELIWVVEPVNQTQWFCKDAYTTIRKRWIDDPPVPAWKKRILGYR
jgi:hypothetical protein